MSEAELHLLYRVIRDAIQHRLQCAEMKLTTPAERARYLSEVSLLSGSLVVLTTTFTHTPKEA